MRRPSCPSLGGADGARCLTGARSVVDRRSGADRRHGRRDGVGSEAGRGAGGAEARAAASIVRHGWTVVAHPQILTQLGKLTSAVRSERAKSTDGGPGPNEKLFAHLMDLALNKIPQNPGSPAFRHGHALGKERTHWFRGKTGNGRYRLFFRYSSSAKVIILAWVNDETTLRTYGSGTDAYAVFSGMLDKNDPPDDWDALVRAANTEHAAQRWTEVAGSKTRKRGPDASPTAAKRRRGKQEPRRYRDD